MGAPNLTRAARGAAVKIRVVDVIHDMGHGDAEAGEVRFVDHALWCAKQRGIRIWKDDNVELRRTALSSLHTLLGKKKSYNMRRNTDTGTNANWVLDIWEIACDDWFRVQSAKPSPEAIEQMEALEAASPAATAALVGPAAKRLSSRILDAYLNRDSDTMLEALHELEQKGL